MPKRLDLERSNLVTHVGYERVYTGSSTGAGPYSPKNFWDTLTYAQIALLNQGVLGSSAPKFLSPTYANITREQKTAQLILAYNFVKCWPIFKIL